MIPSSVQSLSYIKRKANSTIEQQNIKVTKNVIDFHFRKSKLIIRFPSEIKVLRIDPVFSNWVNFNKKVSIINCSTNSKSFKAICFFSSKIQKLKVFEKNVSFFSGSLRSLLFSNCQMAIFCIEKSSISGQSCWKTEILFIRIVLYQLVIVIQSQTKHIQLCLKMK